MADTPAPFDAQVIPPALAAAAPKPVRKSVAKVRAPVVPAPAAPVQLPPAAVPAVLTETKETTMDTITMAAQADTMKPDTMKAQAETMFADASGKAQDVAAKGQKMVGDATSFGKGNVEALVESSKIAARGFETIGQNVADYARKSFEDASAAFRTLSSVKSPTEFMKVQSDLARTAFDAMVADTARSTETMLKLSSEVMQPIQNRVAIAVEKIKIAA